MFNLPSSKNNKKAQSLLYKKKIMKEEKESVIVQKQDDTLSCSYRSKGSTAPTALSCSFRSSGGGSTAALGLSCSIRSTSNYGPSSSYDDVDLGYKQEQIIAIDTSAMIEENEAFFSLDKTTTEEEKEEGDDICSVEEEAEEEKFQQELFLDNMQSFQDTLDDSFIYSSSSIMNKDFEEQQLQQYLQESFRRDILLDDTKSFESMLDDSRRSPEKYYEESSCEFSCC